MLKTNDPKRPVHNFPPPLPNGTAISNIAKARHTACSLLCFSNIQNEEQLVTVLWVGSQIKDQL